MAGSAAQRIHQLDAERTTLLGTTTTEALARANQAVADLVALGFSYSIVNGAGRGRPRKAIMKTRRAKSAAACPICEFRTSPPHDARKHRFSQGKRKRPFTSKELSEMD